MLAWTTDLVGAILGTGIDQFASPFGINGLGKLSGDKLRTLELLAVSADKPGTGQFRAFMLYCKATFETIYVWEIWNDDLRNALVRYGFSDCSRTEPDGEELTGMKWP